jgi:hypothetical protein
MLLFFKSCFFLFLISIFFNSCGAGSSQMKESFTEAKKAIPPDFGKGKTILICVIKNDRYYDVHVKSAVKNNYKGEYIFVSEQDVYNTKYNDKNIYKYLFDYSEGSLKNVVGVKGGSTTYARKQYYIQDRLNNKFYKSGAEFPSYAKAMVAYMKNLELKRISNSN